MYFSNPNLSVRSQQFFPSRSANRRTHFFSAHRVEQTVYRSRIVNKLLIQAMSKLVKLASTQKLVKSDILQLYTKLGYTLPLDTRKESILQNLEENITSDATRSPENVISLDMGLKNMSLSHLHRNEKGVLELHRWFKRNLEPNIQFQFNPVNYSKITCDFLQNEILSYNNTASPLTVVFERQRFRTGGASSVLESTLKTNTIEAMLCMGITLNNYTNSSTIELQPSPPGAMVKYWQNYYLLQRVKNEAESKSFRINLILSMLYGLLQEVNLQPRRYPHMKTLPNVRSKFTLSRLMFDNLSNAASSTDWLASWNKAWSFKSETRRLFEVAYLLHTINNNRTMDNWGVVKGDDLADSLLHGITQFEYASNRRKLFELMHSQADLKSLFRV